MAEKLLKIEEVAARLNKSVTTVRRLCKAKKIGFHGGKNETKTFSEWHITEYLESVEVQPKARVRERQKLMKLDRAKTRTSRPDHYFAEFL